MHAHQFKYLGIGLILLAILHPVFVQASEVREQDSTALVAYLSMRVLMDDIRLLKRCGFISDTNEVEEIFSSALEEPS